MGPNHWHYPTQNKAFEHQAQTQHSQENHQQSWNPQKDVPIQNVLQSGIAKAQNSKNWKTPKHGVNPNPSYPNQGRMTIYYFHHFPAEADISWLAHLQPPLSVGPPWEALAPQ